jgi:dephospho-CoA kinase
MPYAVGLTGGIGSGKTSVAELFRDLGATIVDTDEISRQLTSTGGAATAAIAAQFGADYLAPDGALDRKRMRSLVFADAAARQELEAILHPAIRQAVQAALHAATGPYALIVVPLLVETGAYSDVMQRVLVVDCSEELQVSRVARRSRLSPPEVQAIMASQATRAARLARADDVITNEAGLEALRPQVVALHSRYVALAEQAQAG